MSVTPVDAGPGLQAKVLELLGVPEQNAGGIEATLSELEQRHVA